MSALVRQRQKADRPVPTPILSLRLVAEPSDCGHSQTSYTQTVISHLRQTLIPTFIVLALAGCAHTPFSAADPSSSCRSQDAARAAALVKMPQTAKAIFLAVEADYAPYDNPNAFPDISVDDEGGYWRVSRGRMPVTSGDTIEVTMGGGQLSLRIKKCDGQIDQVHFSR